MNSLQLLIVRILTDLDGAYTNETIFHDPVCLSIPEIIVKIYESPSPPFHSDIYLMRVISRFMKNLIERGYIFCTDDHKYCLIR